MINPQWLELLISRTHLHGTKGVRAIEIWLYTDKTNATYETTDAQKNEEELLQSLW